MKISLKTAWKHIGVTGLIIAALSGNLLYMNIRPADPILVGWEEYNPARFEALMKNDQPVLVEIYASWCPTCLKQHEAFSELVEQGRQPQMVAIRVDFDRDTDFIQKHQIHGTGMLIIFQNGKEISRAAGLVTPDKIWKYTVAYSS